jgi:hypothetical protein
MAKEYPPLEGHSGKHPRFMRHRSGPLRDRRRHCGYGRQRASQRRRSSRGEDLAFGCFADANMSVDIVQAEKQFPSPAERGHD